MAPRAVAVQAGWLNRYRHPHDAMLQRLRARALPLARTDHDGALFWDDERPAQLLAWRRQRARFWQWQAEPEAPDALPFRATTRGPHPNRRSLE